MNKHLAFRILVIVAIGIFVWFTAPFLYRFYLVAIPAAGIYLLLKNLNVFSEEKEIYIRPEDQNWKHRLSFFLRDFFLDFSKLIKKILLTLGLVAFVVGIVIYFSIDILKAKRTQQELNEIAAEISVYKSRNGKTPENLEELIGRNPLKSTWRTDFWSNPILYSISKDGKSYAIVSAGKDGKANTGDDLVAKSN